MGCGAERPGFESRWGKKVFPKDGECEEGRNSKLRRKKEKEREKINFFLKKYPFIFYRVFSVIFTENTCKIYMITLWFLQRSPVNFTEKPCEFYWLFLWFPCSIFEQGILQVLKVWDYPRYIYRMFTGDKWFTGLSCKFYRENICSVPMINIRSFLGSKHCNGILLIVVTYCTMLKL